MRELLAVSNLAISLPRDGVMQEVVHGVSFGIDGGQVVGLVGESGSGKSLTARSLIRLLPGRASLTGSILFEDKEVLEMTNSRLRRHRSQNVGFIFQDPRAHINPVHTVGDFLTEGLVRCRGVDRSTAREVAVHAVAATGVTSPERRLKSYPHELSGGQLQRVMIASVLMMKPRLIVADEPTTALDVTTQAEVIALLAELREQYGAAILLITHDLDLAATVCDQTVVLYAGMVLEAQASRGLYEAPLHPYTAALGASRPLLDVRQERIRSIPGNALSPFNVVDACPFAERCDYRQPRCLERRPQPRSYGVGCSACLRADEAEGLWRSEIDASNE